MKRLSMLAGAVGLATVVATALLAGSAAADGSIGPDKVAGGSQPRATPLITAPVPAGFGSWHEVLAMQERLNGVAVQITTAGAAPGGEGFGAISADPEDREVRLYWKGKLPATMATLLGRVRGEAPVRVLPARYSAREMRNEQQRIIRHPVIAGGHVTKVEPLSDASGLLVSVRESTVAAASVTAADGSAMRLVLEPGVAPAPTVATRYYDTPPFWGGAAWWSGNSGCTTAFAVVQNGAHKLLTAGHCAPNGNYAYTGDPAHDVLNFRHLGVVQQRYPVSPGLFGFWGYVDDLALIDTSPNDTSGWTYMGGFYSEQDAYDDSYALPVGGWQYNVKGNYVFTDGARSGYRWNIKIVGTAVARLSSDNVWTADLVEAEQQDHQNAVGKGDSGGPVGVFSSDFTHVMARGVISLGGDADSVTNCTGVPSSDDRTCYYRVYYEPINIALSDYNATLLTS